MITDLQAHSQNPKLNLQNAGHSYRYFGVDKELNAQAIAEIEEYLKPRIEGFTHFCNFKTNKDGSKSVRYLCMYSPMFQGVGYITLADLAQITFE